MRKAVLYIGMSLDGFIADEYGSVDWMEGHEKESNELGTYMEFEKTVDTVILGYNTYSQVVNELAVNDWPYQDKVSYVLTEKDIDDTENIHFGEANLKELIVDLKRDQGKDIWICGGANIVNQCILDDLIDEYRIAILPVILGKGIRLFNDDNQNIKLQLHKKEEFNGMVELTYTRR